MNNIVTIKQGITNLNYADVNIIVDVIRAFTVSHYAYLAGVEKILLIDSIEDALEYKSIDTILSGEVNAYKISEFDIGNSPYEISQLNLNNKTLVQKTTNGVSVTLNSLKAKNIFVTGFTNALNTAIYVKHLMKKQENFRINIIASHPSGDDDLACAEYIKQIIINSEYNLKALNEATIQRILKSDAAKKFLDDDNKDFLLLDLVKCISMIDTDFIMEVKKDTSSNLPTIFKKEI